MLSGSHYSAYAASSPTVSRSSSQPSPSPRVPRYLRRYTICAATQHRPTSPLAKSFTPDEYSYAQGDDAATDSTHGFSSQWDRRRSEPFTVNPGPKVHHCRYTTIPSPSPSSLFAPVLSPTAVLSRAQSLVADLGPTTQHLRRQPSKTSIRSQSSASSSITECSFHTAVDDQCDDCPIEHPRPQSWADHPLSMKNDWSNSSNSGFRSSGFASRGDQSSPDTVVSPAEGMKQDDNDDGWPVTYLTTITRQELDQYEKENKTRQKRRFTWGRKEGSNFIDNEENRKISRKLKKKRQESLQTDDGAIHAIGARIISIYTEGELEEFDPLKDLPAREEPVTDTVPMQPDETANEIQTEIAISSDDITQSEEHSFHIAIEATHVGQDDEWEDMESNDQHGYLHRNERIQSEDDRDMWLDDTILERIRSRTPQEILQGLDVVHEEEEEDSASEVKIGDALEKRESCTYIENNGKERQDHDIVHGGEPEEQDLLHDIKDQAGELDVADSGKPSEDISQPTQIPSSSRRRKLSKRRRSRRKLNNDSLPPPLPEPKSNTKSEGEKTDARRRTSPASKKASIPTLRPRRAPKTVMSSVRFHVFRPLSSFALFLGIDVTNGKRRLSRELRTPNSLLVGRHFSEKHIPRFPSRLDGKRTVDKKIAKYE